ncbi:phosphoesterase [Candidatus Woesearchaeota archaeon]|nr:MAG: phosphoesterase [Candidatus Woesearchaeota archaeon]
MKLIKNIELIDLAIYLLEHKILIIADTHIGLEEALNKQGVLVPRFQFKEVIDRLNKIFDRLKKEGKKVELVVLNGDIKHEFGTISEQEWRSTLRLLDYLIKKGKKVMLVKGNHDTILGPIAKKRNVKIVNHHSIGDIYICHGHVIPEDIEFTKAKIVIIGHEHPAISIHDELRSEIFKCYLIGKWKKKYLIVQPSFNFVTEGTDVLKEKLLSPFLKDISKLKTIVVADNLYDFGSVKSLLKK